MAPQELIRLRAALRFAREPRVETILREVIADAGTGWPHWSGRSSTGLTAGAQGAERHLVIKDASAWRAGIQYRRSEAPVAAAVAADGHACDP